MGAPSDTPSMPTPGETAKAVQKGELPAGSVEQILEAAPKDIVHKVLDVPEWGYSIKIKSATAAESAAVKQRGIGFKGEETTVAWAEMEIMQFQLGVEGPKFSEENVRQLHLSSGPGFARVIDALDEISKIDKEKLRKAREEFPGDQQQSEA